MTDLDTNNPPVHYKSLFIFIGYLCLATLLIFICCRTIYVRYQARWQENDWATPQRRGQLLLFTFLAALSLGTTWYYMISFFIYSFNSWETHSDGLLYSVRESPLVIRMGFWLNETYVFQQAWETVSENTSRVWWSGQIFGWTIGWSLFLGLTGRRYHIPHVWIFMLVAQGVSVSFAANLFFAAITVSQQPDEKNITYMWHPRLVYELVPVVLSLLGTLAVPIFAYKSIFMPILLAPHLLVFIPCVLGPRSSLPSMKANNANAEDTTQRYVTLVGFVTAASVAIQAYLTIFMLQDIGTDRSYSEIAQHLIDTVYVHPACSSVSWDVIMCAVSAYAWVLVNDFNTSFMLGGK